MIPVNVKNITLQFDTSEHVNEDLINSMIELVNNTLSNVHSFSQPQIIKQDDTKFIVIDLLDIED